jgi:hypothetical protein
VSLPGDYGLTSSTYRLIAMIFRRDITLQQNSPYRTDRRKALEDIQAKQPGTDAVVRFSGLRGSLALRTDQYPPRSPPMLPSRHCFDSYGSDGEALGKIEDRKPYPRPTNGILVAMTVMNSTLASSGRLAI